MSLYEFADDCLFFEARNYASSGCVDVSGRGDAVEEDHADHGCHDEIVDHQPRDFHRISLVVGPLPAQQS